MDTSATSEEWASTSSESSEEPEAPSCETCQKSQNDLPSALKRCGKCQTTRYCSVECQKEDWKAHKRTCGKPADKHNPGFHGASSLLGLTGNDNFHSLPEKDVLTQLIDCYRLRVEDEYTFKGDAGGLYGGEDPLPDFKRFLNKAEKRKGVLPEWWSKEKRKECEKEATSGKWANINCAVEKSDIVEHYKNPLMPMTLRVLGERIYGKGFM